MNDLIGQSICISEEAFIYPNVYGGDFVVIYLFWWLVPVTQTAQHFESEVETLVLPMSAT